MRKVKPGNEEPRHFLRSSSSRGRTVKDRFLLVGEGWIVTISKSRWVLEEVYVILGSCVRRAYRKIRDKDSLFGLMVGIFEWSRILKCIMKVKWLSRTVTLRPNWKGGGIQAPCEDIDL